MESKRSSNISGEKREEYWASSEKEEDKEENDSEVLKRRISNHPLYELLVEQHLNCLKVSEISNLEKVQEKKEEIKKAMKKQTLGMYSQSELDHFMEAYCMALGKLKEGMAEPQIESMAFINNMHSQLRDLAGTTTFSSSSSSSSSPSPQSSSPHSNFQTRP